MQPCRTFRGMYTDDTEAMEANLPPIAPSSSKKPPGGKHWADSEEAAKNIVRTAFQAGSDENLGRLTKKVTSL